MKLKTCADCAKPTAVAYRVSSSPQASWRFVCPHCLPAAQQRQGYRYGGTWKGARH